MSTSAFQLPLPITTLHYPSTHIMQCPLALLYISAGTSGCTMSIPGMDVIGVVEKLWNLGLQIKAAYEANKEDAGESLRLLQRLQAMAAVIPAALMQPAQSQGDRDPVYDTILVGLDAAIVETAGRLVEDITFARDAIYSCLFCNKSLKAQ